jgi:hypothetical protein
VQWVETFSLDLRKGRRMILRRVQLIVIFFSVWMLAIVLPALRFAPGNWDVLRRSMMKKPPALESHSLLLEFLALFLAAGVIVLIGFIILSLWRSRRKKKKDDDFFIYHENSRATWLVYVVLLLLILGTGGFVWIARHYLSMSERWVVPEQRIEAPENLRPPTPPSPSQASTAHKPMVPRWSGYLLVAGLLILVGLGSWRILKNRYKPMETELPAVGEIAAKAAADLERGADLPDIVLRCYREMCEILSQKVRFSGEMTAREFALRLQQEGVREQEVTDLTTLFERVRYGHYETGPEERKEAILGLKAIEKQYRGPPDED